MTPELEEAQKLLRVAKADREVFINRRNARILSEQY